MGSDHLDSDLQAAARRLGPCVVCRDQKRLNLRLFAGDDGATNDDAVEKDDGATAVRGRGKQDTKQKQQPRDDGVFRLPDSPTPDAFPLAIIRKEPQPKSARDVADAIAKELSDAKALGAPPKHPSMEKAKDIEVAMRREEKDRIADQVLMLAQKMQDEDARAADAAAPSVLPVGAAAGRADAIEKSIKHAVSTDNVPKTHTLLDEALGVAKALRDLDGERKRLAARELRLATTG